MRIRVTDEWDHESIIDELERRTGSWMLNIPTPLYLTGVFGADGVQGNGGPVEDERIFRWKVWQEQGLDDIAAVFFPNDVPEWIRAGVRLH